MDKQGMQSSKTVLVVDDDQFFIDLISGTLEEEDYYVQGATSGKQALDKLNEMRPDIILLDLELPDMHGLQIVEFLSMHKLFKSIPVIITTADKTENAIEVAFAFNIYDYIIKPINPRLLPKQLRNALKNHAVENALNKSEARLEQLQKLGGIGTWEYDMQSSRFVISDEFNTVLDIANRPGDLSFDEFLSYVNADDREQFKHLIIAAIHDGKPFSFEHYIHNRSGLERLVLHQVHVHQKINTDNYAVIGAILDVTERRNEQNLITYTRFYDRVTELPNRENFYNRLNALITQNERREKLLAVLMIGIDRFKDINETLGRVVGDQVLAHLSKMLQNCANIEAYRYAGDVFALIIRDMDTIQPAEKFARNVIDKLSEPLVFNYQELYVYVSIGMSVYPMVQGDKDDLISSAENAMYQAKRAGSNKLVCFDKAAFRRNTSRLHLETDLRKALDKEQFEIYYQPQVEVESGYLIGMEALLRWKHPQHGTIMPDNFIPIAESTGLIVPLGNWVMETAARQLAHWHNAGHGLLRLGVNLSSRQFEDKHLFNTVVDVIERAGIPACALDLELTETSAMRDIRQTINILGQLNEAGVQVSLDDFGMGYSSLNYLNKMPLQTIKIDRSFIKNIGKNGENGELARLIIAMCHSLGLNIIAEGVEKLEQLLFLRDHQCTEAQGYWFSPPVSRQGFELFFSGKKTASHIKYSYPIFEILL